MLGKEGYSPLEVDGRKGKKSGWCSCLCSPCTALCEEGQHNGQYPPSAISGQPLEETEIEFAGATSMAEFEAKDAPTPDLLTSIVRFAWTLWSFLTCGCLMLVIMFGGLFCYSFLATVPLSIVAGYFTELRERFYKFSRGTMGKYNDVEVLCMRPAKPSQSSSSSAKDNLDHGKATDQTQPGRAWIQRSWTGFTHCVPPLAMFAVIYPAKTMPIALCIGVCVLLPAAFIDVARDYLSRLDCIRSRCCEIACCCCLCPSLCAKRNSVNCFPLDACYDGEVKKEFGTMQHIIFERKSLAELVGEVVQVSPDASTGLWSPCCSEIGERLPRPPLQRENAIDPKYFLDGLKAPAAKAPAASQGMHDEHDELHMAPPKFWVRAPPKFWGSRYFVNLVMVLRLVGGLCMGKFVGAHGFGEYGVPICSCIFIMLVQLCNLTSSEPTRVIIDTHFEAVDKIAILYKFLKSLETLDNAPIDCDCPFIDIDGSHLLNGKVSIEHGDPALPKEHGDLNGLEARCALLYRNTCSWEKLRQIGRGYCDVGMEYFERVVLNSFLFCSCLLFVIICGYLLACTIPDEATALKALVYTHVIVYTMWFCILNGAVGMIFVYMLRLNDLLSGHKGFAVQVRERFALTLDKYVKDIKAEVDVKILPAVIDIKDRMASIVSQIDMMEKPLCMFGFEVTRTSLQKWGLLVLAGIIAWSKTQIKAAAHEWLASSMLTVPSILPRGFKHVSPQCNCIAGKLELESTSRYLTRWMGMALTKNYKEHPMFKSDGVLEKFILFLTTSDGEASSQTTTPCNQVQLRKNFACMQYHIDLDANKKFCPRPKAEKKSEYEECQKQVDNWDGQPQ